MRMKKYLIVVFNIILIGISIIIAKFLCNLLFNKLNVILVMLDIVGIITYISFKHPCNILSFIKNNIKKIIMLLLLEALCLWMCIYKSMTISDHSIYLSFYFFIFSIIMTLIFWAFIALFVEQITYWKIYPMIGFVIGFVFLLCIPINIVPDEHAHLWSAYHLSNEILRTDQYDGKYIGGRADDVNYPVKERGYTLNDFEDYLNEMTAPIKNTKIIKGVNYSLDTKDYLYYLPAIGITIGRILGLGTIMTFLLGRLLNLIFFVVIISLAISLASRGKMILFALSLMPMTIQQGMSFSYDVFVIAVSFFIIAMVTRILENKISKYNFVVLLLACLLLLPVKSYAYAPIALLPFAILISNKLNIKSILSLLAVGILIGLGFIALIRLKIAPQFLLEKIGTIKYIEWAGHDSYSVLHFIQYPKDVIRVISATVYTLSDFYVESFIGNALGSFEYVLPYMNTCYTILLTVAVFIDKEGERVTNKQWFIIMLMSLLNIIFIFTGLLFTWTPSTSYAILGVQGRYFIPIGALILLFFNDKLSVNIDNSNENKYFVIIIIILLAMATDSILVFMNR